jgi:hypothetical protein
MGMLEAELDYQLGRRNGKRLAAVRAVAEHVRDTPHAYVVVLSHTLAHAEQQRRMVEVELRKEFRDDEIKYDRASNRFIVNGAQIKFIVRGDWYEAKKIAGSRPTAAWT